MVQYLMPRLVLGGLVLLAVGAVAPAQAANRQAVSCPGCELFETSCTVNCLGIEEPGQALTCLRACETAAAACSCDDEVTLSSEELVKQGWVAGPAATEAACHPPTTCPPEYSSCASWSSTMECGDPYCGTFKFCGDPPFCHEPDLCFGPATYQPKERFRVCFNASGQPCTEYQSIATVPTCGC